MPVAVFALAFAYTTEIIVVTVIAHRDQAVADYDPTAIISGASVCLIDCNVDWMGPSLPRIVLSARIEIALVMPNILEVRKRFQPLEVKLLRGTASQVAEFTKSSGAVATCS